MDTTRIIPRIRAKAFVSDEGTLEDLAADKARVKVFPWVHQAPEVCPEEVVRSQKTVVEGFGATACFFDKCRDCGVDMPILAETHAILHQGKEPSKAIRDLMNRDLKAESQAQ